MSDEALVLLVQLADKRCGLLAEDVLEVLPAVRITHLPGGPEFVEGVIDLRGTGVAVLDLRRRFGIRRRPLSPDDRLVLVQIEDRPLALRVDRALDLRTVPAHEMDTSAVPFADPEHAAGLIRLPDGLVVISDPARLLSSEASELLREALDEIGVVAGPSC